MRIICFLIFINISLISYSQDIYWSKTERDLRQLTIDTLFINGNYRNSLELSLLSLNFYPNDTDYIAIQKNEIKRNFVLCVLYKNIIRGYAHINNTDSAFIWIDRLLLVAKPEFEYFFTDEFSPLMIKREYSKYTEKSIMLVKKLYPMIDSIFFCEMMRAYMKPSVYITTMAVNKVYLPPLYRDKLLNIIQTITESCKISIDSLLLHFGYPKEVKCNSIIKDSINYFFNLPLELNLRFDFHDLSNEIFKNKRIDKYRYAQMLDNYLIKENCPQIYGTQYWIDSMTHKSYIYPVEDKNNIEFIRQINGFIPLNVNEIEFKNDGKKY